MLSRSIRSTDIHTSLILHTPTDDIVLADHDSGQFYDYDFVTHAFNPR